MLVLLETETLKKPMQKELLDNALIFWSKGVKKKIK